MSKACASAPKKNDESVTTYLLQIQFVNRPNEIIKNESKIMILFDGRDAAGKDGAIKHIADDINSRDTRIVPLRKPGGSSQYSWRVHEWVPHITATGEMVLFSRGLYYCAVVVPGMEFDSKDDGSEFLHSDNIYEQMLLSSLIQLFRCYLDISTNWQKRCLENRRSNPSIHGVISPVDKESQDHREDYYHANNTTFEGPTHPSASRSIVTINNKNEARVNLMRYVLLRGEYRYNHNNARRIDHNIIFSFERPD